MSADVRRLTSSLDVSNSQHRAQHSEERVEAPPIFLIGGHRRSGTNFVSEALQLHPDIATPLPLTEDYLLYASHLLQQYVDTTVETHWRKRFSTPEEVEVCAQALCRHLGAALYAFLRERIDPSKRLFTKTPDPDNVERFFTFFPNAKLILLVRDGRDVVESAHRSWPGTSYEHWMRAWAAGARRLLQFTRGVGHACATRWRLYRYEELLRDRAQFEDLLAFVEADARVYPWERLEALPTRGSSENRGGRTELHWDPVERPKNFNPLGRWSHWGWWRRWQFKRLAGAELRALGYVSDNNW